MAELLQTKHTRLHKAKVLANYAIRHPIDFTKKSIKIYKDAKTNVSEGGMAISTALFGLSLALPPIITSATYITHDMLKSLPTNTVNLIALGLVGIMSLTSIPLEARALREKGFSNSIPASAVYITTKAENFTAVLMNFYHLGFHIGVSGLSIQVLNALLGNHGRFFSSGVITTAIVLSIWNNVTLRPIISGKIDPYVEKINKISEKVKNKIVEKIPLNVSKQLFGDPTKNFRLDLSN